MKRIKVAIAIGVAALAGVIVAAFAWWVASSERVEPAYDGRPLSAWMRDFDESPHHEARSALRHIGASAVPTLVRMFSADDRSIKARLLALLAEHHVLKFTYVPALVQQDEALGGFEALGGAAENAVPQLVRMYGGLRSRRYEVTCALAFIGPAAKAAIPYLLRDLKSQDSSVRADVLWALGRIHSEAQLVVPAMISALQDPDDGVRYYAVAGLSDYGTNAWSALPALRQLRVVEPQDTMAGLELERTLKRVSGEEPVPDESD